VAVPAVGFGCSEYRGGDEYVDLEPTIRAAMDAGYRLFDGAELYGTDPVVGRLLDEPGAPPRGACYLLGKVWNTNHEPDRVRAACDRALAAFGVDRLDGFALHWPEAWAHAGALDGLRGLSHAERERLTFPRDDDGEIRTAEVDLATTWRAMESLVDRGLVRHLGLCNVDRETLVGLCGRARRPPAFVEVEHHPYEPATDLRAACRERGVRVIGHTPLGPDGLLAEPAVTEAADAHGVTPAQVVLRRAVERGVVPIPSTTSRAHLVENLDLFGFALDPAERDRIDGLAGSA
jgi:alcohol dehydrogenase (NADP+)